jgi:hypothetical protein
VDTAGPAALGGLLTGSWMGFVTGLLWGGLARIFLVHHVTWSINSICHLWGSQPFRTGDQSRNNFVFGALGFGEGWHNNHHAFPTSARFGLRWWQIDLGYWFICVLAGWAWPHEYGHQVEGKMNKLKVVAIAVIAVVAVIVVFQNTQVVETKLLFLTLTSKRGPVVWNVNRRLCDWGINRGHIVSRASDSCQIN